MEKHFKLVEESRKNPCADSPLITIITAVFNAKETLEETILSVMSQSYDNIEFIVVDGGSTDGSLDILRKYQHAIDHWISEPDHGIYDAWNKGVRLSGGDWIYFLGADDILHDNETLQNVSNLLGAIPQEIKVVYGKVMLLSQTAVEISVVGDPWEEIKSRFLEVMSMPHQGVFHRNSLFEKYGEFDTSFRIAGDYEFLLRELKDGDATYMPFIISGMRQGGVSNKPENTIRALQEIRRAQKQHGFKKPSWTWISAYMRAHIRTLAWRLFGEKFVSHMSDVYRKMRGLPPYWTKL